jgi:hypothetical protein
VRVARGAEGRFIAILKHFKTDAAVPGARRAHAVRDVRIEPAHEARAARRGEEAVRLRGANPDGMAVFFH